MSRSDSRAFQGVSAILHRVFENALGNGASGSLSLPDGQALFVNPLSAADVATLPQAASLCHRYLKLADGDVALTNDPYSGGTHLAEFTLVTGVSLAGGPSKGDVDLLLARRVAFAPRLPSELKSAAKIDAEGVRVPPMPLGRLDQLNRDLIQAIAMHPLAPRELFAALENACAEMRNTVAVLKRISEDPGAVLNKKNLGAHVETYFADSARVFEMQMAKLPLGSSLVSHEFPTGETIKLELRITEDRLAFDFGGSESSPTLGLTDLATFGACFAAIASAIESWVPMNAATFQHLQVSAPSRTILSATAPLGTTRGMLEGVPAVCRLAREALTRLNKNFRTATSANANTAVQFLFDDGRLLSLAIPHGTGASPQSTGIDGVNLWMATPTVFGGLAPNSGSKSDIERLDGDFPVRLLAAGVRVASSGHGKTPGGNGAKVGLKILAPCEVRWFEPALGARPSGIDTGRSGTASTIEIVHGDGTREELAGASGVRRFQAGEELFVLTSGGGGCGEPPTPEQN